MSGQFGGTNPLRAIYAELQAIEADVYRAGDLITRAAKANEATLLRVRALRGRILPILGEAPK